MEPKMVPDPSTELDWLKYNITPEYLKTTLEDLANDQLDFEDKLTEQNKRIMLSMGASMAAVGISVLIMKQLKAMMGGISMLAGHMQEIDRFLTGGVVTPVGEPAKESVPKEEGTYPPGPVTEDTIGVDTSVPLQTPASQETPAVEIGASYDPGPQPGPNDPLPPVFDDSEGIR